MKPINLPKLLALHKQALAQGISYGLGAKAKSMSTPLSSISRIDCSGYFRWLVSNSTGMETIPPDGSWIQREWAEKQGLKPVAYSTAVKDRTGKLYVAFMTSGVNGVGKVGHIWFVHNGLTIESRGGKGVDSRAANRTSYMNMVHKCFELPTVEAATKPTAPVSAPVVPSLVISVFEDGKWSNTRIPAHQEPGVNFAPAQKLLQLAGVQYQVSNWADGTPNIRIVK